LFDPYEFEAIDWDDEDDEDGNLVHCLRHGVSERIVYDVIRLEPAQIRFRVQTADFAVVGPDSGGTCWTLLFDRSHKRGDWLRPVTGWRSEPAEVNAWRQATGN
jgi:hypothetical protein